MATLPATLDFHLGVQTDLMLSIPTYVFATPVFGGQLSVGLLIPYGRNKVSVDQTLVGPRGNAFPSTTGGPLTESVSGIGDLEPQTSLRWNFGVHNFMVYATGDIPVGLYSPVQLANIGYGHGAIDGGAGYTYFNEKTGHELSAVLGFTYNFNNPSTQYQNGVDVHLDWSASQFLTKQIELGAAGYFYNQASCDTGAGAVLGCFETRVLGGRAAAWLRDPDGQPAGLRQHQSVPGFRLGPPRRGLERVADIRDLELSHGRATHPTAPVTVRRALAPRYERHRACPAK